MGKNLKSIVVVAILVCLLGYLMLVYTFQISKFMQMMMCITWLIYTSGYDMGSSASLLKLFLHICFKEDTIQPWRRGLHSILLFCIEFILVFFGCVVVRFSWYVAYYFCKRCDDVMWCVYFFRWYAILMMLSCFSLCVFIHSRNWCSL